MIERELKRKFPGVQFHHIDTSAIDASDREGFGLRTRAHIHNLAHTTYDATVIAKESRKLTHATREVLERQSTKVDKAYTDVIDTNKALPTELRGRHSR